MWPPGHAGPRRLRFDPELDAVEQVRDAAEVFLDALKDTGSTARVVDFGTVARQTAPADLVTTPSMQPAGVHGQALEHYYNPKPTVNPQHVTVRRQWRRHQRFEFLRPTTRINGPTGRCAPGRRRGTLGAGGLRHRR